MPKLFNKNAVSSENAFLEEYSRKIRSLQKRFPHYRIMKDLVELDDALKVSIWGRVEAATAFHRTVERFSELVIREKIPCIYVNTEVRERYKSHFEELPLSVRTGKILFDPLDLADWFMRRACLSVESVVVPLTMLAENPEELFQVFLAEKAQKLPSMIAGKKTKDYENRLCTWGCMRYIKPQYRDRIGRWYEKLLNKVDPEKFPSVNLVTLPACPVRLNQRLIPPFFTQGEIAQANGYTCNSIVGRRIARHLGMMNVRLDENVDRALVTYGPRVGADRDAPCFEAGLVDIWTAQEFVDEFGIEALNTGKWLMPKEAQVPWTEKPIEYGVFPNYLQMKTLLALDYIRKDNRSTSYLSRKLI